jgi:diguanylate cyclase (GGDEF)-like protein/PAS domain S-box-containing protein
MDRMTSKPALVAEALALIAAPACACDAQGMVWAANAAMVDMIGAPLEGRPLLSLFCARSANEAAAAIRQALGGARRWHGLVARASQELAVEVRAQPLPASAGIGGATFVFHDAPSPCATACPGQVPALPGQSAALEHAAVLEHAPVGIVVTLPDLVKSFNPRMAAMLGLAPGEMVGRSPAEVFASRSAYDAFTAEAIPRLSAGHLFEKDEVQMRHRDGSAIWCRIRAKAVDTEARDAGTVWILEDVTAARQALSEVEAIMTNASIAIFFTRERTIGRHNGCFSRMFGYDDGEAEGLSTRVLFADDAAYAAHGTEAYAVLGQGRSFKNETALVRKGGTPMWVSVIGFAANPAERGQHGATVWMIEDRTAQREAAEALRRARDELEVRVQERTAELQAEIVERRQAEARVHHMAYHDALTGLPNRALLSDRLDRALQGAQRDGRKLALLFIDLDRFKTINDSLGHLAGDHLLKEVAQRLCRVVRAADTVARLGGDEFVVLVPGVRGADECGLVGDKIIAALADPVMFEGRGLHISPSIGICLYPDDGADVASLMRKADAAMYQAKAAGRNNYQFFAERMNRAAERHFELETRLRGALMRQEFTLSYQPIVTAADTRVHGLEVLLRWRDAELGAVGPDEFIPILEENGLIVPVGEWVIRSACEQAVAWQRAGQRPLPLAINLSARQFMHRGLIQAIRRIVDETGIDPAQLEFEITETALMQHGGQTLETLGHIFNMGIRLSIDDFGTGYSSLAYLKRFPVRKIKIDRAFVRDLEASSEDQAIVAAIMALAGSLQLAVVAEGVETPGQLAILRRQGCEYAQGYLFARPMEGGLVPGLLAGES